MTELVITCEVHSPRWGRTDTYRLELSQEKMVVSMGVRAATCRKVGDSDPTWDGYRTGSPHPLIAIFTNDSIYPPEVVVRALEWAWTEWKAAEKTDEEMKAGIAELFQWVDSTARAKPRSDFWSPYF